jgi:uncharacterized protein YodC (DUF2158 family)
MSFSFGLRGRFVGGPRCTATDPLCTGSMEARHYNGAAILLHRNKLGFSPLNQALAGGFMA